MRISLVSSLNVISTKKNCERFRSKVGNHYFHGNRAAFRTYQRTINKRLKIVLLFLKNLKNALRWSKMYLTKWRYERTDGNWTVRAINKQEQTWLYFWSAQGRRFLSEILGQNIGHVYFFMVQCNLKIKVDLNFIEMNFMNQIMIPILLC